MLRHGRDLETVWGRTEPVRRQPLRNSLYVKRRSLTYVSQSMQEEWATGVSQWAARREVERANLYFRRKMGLIKGHSTDEWNEGYGEWQDRALVSQAWKWLRRPGRGRNLSQVKRRVSAGISKSVARSIAIRELQISQKQSIPKQRAPEAKPQPAREDQVPATQLETDQSREEELPSVVESEKETRSLGKKKIFLWGSLGLVCVILAMWLAPKLDSINSSVRTPDLNDKKATGNSDGLNSNPQNIGTPPIIQENLKKGLLAYYPFDGNAKDMSGNGHHGEATGPAPAPDRHGKANHAYPQLQRS